MHDVRTAEREDAVALPAIEDEDLARWSAATVLITAPTPRRVATLARRIHEGGMRTQSPFVHLSAGDLPVDSEALGEYCASILDAAAGGSVLINDVEEMPAVVQETLMDLLARLESARQPSTAVRLISGTTVSLFDRVAARTFSERLFYRLNFIHLTTGDRPSGSRAPENLPGSDKHPD